MFEIRDKHTAISKILKVIYKVLDLICKVEEQCAAGNMPPVVSDGFCQDEVNNAEVTNKTYEFEKDASLQLSAPSVNGNVEVNNTTMSTAIIITNNKQRESIPPPLDVTGDHHMLEEKDYQPVSSSSDDLNSFAELETLRCCPMHS